MSGAKRGPKPIQIDWAQFDKLCEFQCTLNEIAAWFECSIDTIENKVKEAHGVKFSDYYDQKRGRGKVSLRRKQWNVAMKGDKTMLIWLGKQYLSQSDKIEVEETSELVTNFEKDESSTTKE